MEKEIEAMLDELSKKLTMNMQNSEPKEISESHNSVQDVRKTTGETSDTKVMVDERKPSDMDVLNKKVESLIHIVDGMSKQNDLLATKRAITADLTPPNNTIPEDGLVGITNSIQKDVEKFIYGKKGKVN